MTSAIARGAWLAAVLTFAIDGRSAVAQVIPPSVVRSDANAAASMTPPPQVTPAGADKAMNGIPPENRCGVSGSSPSVGGSVGPMRDGRTVALAAVVDPAGGRAIEDFYGTEMAAAQRTVDIQGDPDAMRAEQNRILALVYDRARRFHSAEDATESVQREVRHVEQAEDSLHHGKYVIVPSSGSYRCGGLTTGRHDLLVLVMHWEVLTHASLIGKAALKMTLYASQVDVPHHDSRAYVRADHLRLIGEIDPNGSQKYLQSIKAKPAT